MRENIIELIAVLKISFPIMHKYVAVSCVLFAVATVLT